MTASDFRIVARDLRGGCKTTRVLKQFVAVDVGDLDGAAVLPFDGLAADVHRWRKDGLRRQVSATYADLEEPVLVRADEFYRCAILRLAQVRLIDPVGAALARVPEDGRPGQDIRRCGDRFEQSRSRSHKPPDAAPRMMPIFCGAPLK